MSVLYIAGIVVIDLPQNLCDFVNLNLIVFFYIILYGMHYDLLCKRSSTFLKLALLGE